MEDNKKILGLIVLFCLPSLLFNINPAKFPADDGFFYPQIAYNIVQGFGITFNKIYSTNGFHPLWMIICVLLEFINPFGKEFVLHLIWLVQIILFVLSLKNILSIFKENTFALVVSFVFLTLIFLSIGTLYLSEAFINLYFLTIIFRFVLVNNSNSFLFGVLLGGCFLARLDNIFIIIFISIYYLFINNSFSIKKISFTILGFMLIAAPYLLSNYLQFKHFVPISGIIKSSFPVIKWDFDAVYDYLFILIGYLSCIKFLEPDDKLRKVKITFISGSIFYLLFLACFQSQIGQWYFISQYLCLSFFLYDLVRFITQKVKIFNSKWLHSSIIFLFFILIFSVTLLKLYANFSIYATILGNNKFEFEKEDKVSSYIKYVSCKIPPKEKIFVYDAPGKLAFYSQFKIISADGLIANFSFNENIKNKGIQKYLIDNQINYVLTPNDFRPSFVSNRLNLHIIKKDKKYRINYYSPIGNVYCGQINLNNYKPLLINQNPLARWQPEYSLVTLWKFKNNKLKK